MHNAEKPNPPASVRDTGGRGYCGRRPTLEPETASAQPPDAARATGEFMGRGFLALSSEPLRRKAVLSLLRFALFAFRCLAVG